MAIYGARLL